MTRCGLSLSDESLNQMPAATTAIPSVVMDSHGYAAMIALARFGSNRDHIDCFARGLQLSFELNPDVHSQPLSILARVLSTTSHRYDTSRLNLVKKLLNLVIDAGADINHPCSAEGFSALQLAICAGVHQQLIELLLKRGAAVNLITALVTANGVLKVTALDLALGQSMYSDEPRYSETVINLLKRAGAKTHSGAHTYRFQHAKVAEEDGLRFPSQGHVARSVVQDQMLRQLVEDELLNPTHTYGRFKQMTKAHPDCYLSADLLVKVMLYKREDFANFLLKNVPCQIIRYANAHVLGYIGSLLCFAVLMNMNTTAQILLERGVNPNDFVFFTYHDSWLICFHTCQFNRFKVEGYSSNLITR